MTPLELDLITGGAKIHIYRRHDQTVYASVNDFSKFGVEPLETVRVPLTAISTVESVLENKKVTAAIKRHSR